jgi:hypothetical protein
MHNRILAILVGLSMLFAFAVNASGAEAVETMPDLTQKGSLTFRMDVDGVPLDGGKLNLYYVATVELVSEKVYDFRLLDALVRGGGTLDTQALYDGVQAQRLLGCAQEVLEGYLSAPIAAGRAQFSDLEAGLYLIWQRPEDATAGYAAIAPFLISVPKWQDGQYTLQVVADPKVPFETEPTEPPPSTTPPPPPPPELPQTGQLNWPVPVMAVTGALLIIVGWILCAGRKRCEHEK